MSSLDRVYGKTEPQSALDRVYNDAEPQSALDRVYGASKPKGSFWERVHETMKERFEESWDAEIQRALTRGWRRSKGALPGTISGFTDIAGGTAMGAMQRLMPLPEEQYEEMQEQRRGMTAGLRKTAKKQYESADIPELQPRKGGIGGYIVNTVSETVPMALEAIGATLIVGPAGGFIVGGAVESEAHVQEAMRKTGLSEEDLAKERLLVFMISGAIEQMQADEVLKLSKAGLKPVIEAAKQRAWNKLGKEAGKLSAKHLAGAASEALEETLQEATSIGAASLHGEKVATVENLKRLGGAALGGAVGYGGLGVAGAGVRTGIQQRTPGARFTTKAERELQIRLDQSKQRPVAEAEVILANYRAKLKDPDLVNHAVIVETYAGLQAAVPIGGSRESGTLDSMFADKADAQKALEVIRGKPGFPNLRIKFDERSEQYSIVWGEDVTPDASHEEQAEAYGYTEAALRDFYTASNEDITLQATLDQGVDPVMRKPTLLTFVEPEEVTQEVKEKYDLADPDSTVEKARTEDVLDAYWGQRDERQFEINTIVNTLQQKIAQVLGKKTYDPETDQETADASLAMMLYIDAKQYPEHTQFLDQLTDEQKRLYDMSQNLSPELQEIADQVIALEQQSGQFGLDQGVLHNVLEHHIAHIWKVDKKRKGGLFGIFRTRTKFAKQRSLDTGGILEGWARGMELEVADVTGAMQIAMQHVNEAVAGKHLIRLAKDWGLVTTKRKAGEDFVELDHSDFSTWQHAGEVEVDPEAPLKPGTRVRAADRKNFGKVIKVSEDGQTATVHFKNRAEGTEATVQLNTTDLEPIRSYGENFFVGEDGTLMERVKLWAAPQLGKKLNRVTKRSGIRETPIGEWALRQNALLKHIILSTSFFHHQAFVRSYALGSRGINPKRAYEIGKNAIMNLDPQARLLVRNGLTLGRIQDYDPQFIHSDKSIWGRALSLTRPGEKVRGALVKLRNSNERFLFQQLGPYLKMTSALLELQAEVKRNQTKLENGEVTVDELAARVAKLMNDDFGGLHLGRMGRGRTVQDFFRLLCLAPDWTESNVRSMINAFRRGDEGKLYRAFWGRIAMKGLGATVAFNLLMSAFDDDDFWERYKKSWEAGDLRWLEVDVTPIARLFPGTKPEERKYFSLIGHFKDPIKFVVHPIRSAKHKGSIATRFLADAWTGSDWAGRDFTSIGELTGLTLEDGRLGYDPEAREGLVKWEFGGGRPVTYETMPSYLTYEARSTLPIQVQNALAFAGGEMDTFDMLTKGLGMATATHTPTETGRTRKTRKRRTRRRRKR